MATEQEPLFHEDDAAHGLQLPMQRVVQQTIMTAEAPILEEAALTALSAR